MTQTKRRLFLIEYLLSESNIKVIFNVFKDDDYAIYSKLLRS